MFLQDGIDRMKMGKYCFWILLIYSTQIFSFFCEPQNSFIESELTGLPEWFFPSYLFEECKVPTIRIEKDENGSICCLSRTVEGIVVDAIFCSWEKKENIPYLSRVHFPQRNLLHEFIYDEQERTCHHIVSGNLSGLQQDSVEKYSSKGIFSKEGLLVQIEEDEGCTVVLCPFENKRVEVCGNEVLCSHTCTADGDEITQYGKKSFWKKRKFDSSTKDQYTICYGCVDEYGSEHLLRTEYWKKVPYGEELVCVSDTSGQKIKDPYTYAGYKEEDLFSIIGFQDFESIDKSSEVLVSAEYNSRGQITRLVYPSGLEKKFTYTLRGQIAHISFPHNAKVFFTYDAGGRKKTALLYQEYAQEPIRRTYVYEEGFLHKIVDNPGYVYEFFRDVFGRIEKIAISKEPFAKLETALYEVPVLKDGLIVQNSMAKAIDEALSSHNLVPPQVENVSSFAKGSKDSTIFRTISITYDALSRYTAITAQGLLPFEVFFAYSASTIQRSTIQYVHDKTAVTTIDTCTADGRRLSHLRGDTEIFYDKQGRIAKVLEKGVVVVQKSYTLSKEGIEEISEFSDRGKMVELRTGKGVLRKREWFDGDNCSLFREVLETDGRTYTLKRYSKDDFQSFSWDVNEQNHIQTVFFPDGRKVHYTYDTRGLCVAKQVGMHPTVYFSYDDLGRMIRLYTSDSSIDYTYTYDSYGRIVSATDCKRKATVKRNFDEIGQIFSDGEEGYEISVQYGEPGKIIKVQYPDCFSVAYDALGIICSTTKATFRLDKVVQLQKTLPHHNTDLFGQISLSKKYPFTPFGKQTNLHTIADFDTEGNCIYLKKSSRKYVYDALGRLFKAYSDGEVEEYYYDGFGRISQVVTNGRVKHLLRFDDLDLGLMVGTEVYERNIIDPETQQTAFLEIFGNMYEGMTDTRGSVLSLKNLQSFESHTFSYAPFGAVSSENTNFLPPYGFCGKRYFPIAQCYDFGARRLQPDLKRYLEPDPLGIVDTVDDRIFCRNNPELFSDPMGLFSKVVDPVDIGTKIKNSLEFAASNIYRSITFAKKRLDWLLELRNYYEDLFFTLMGRTWLRLLGYNLDPTSLGVVNNNFSLKNVRITSINGILNGSFEAQKLARFLSEAHGKAPVYFVYSATQGFSSDLLRGACSKAGIVSPQAKILCSLWRTLLEEMEEDGCIWHYAHSLGAADTQIALRYMTPKEKKRIKVITFGSLTIVKDAECFNVDNYISVHDGVPLLDTVAYIRALYSEDPHVHFLSSTTLPLMDHYITGDAYKTVLEMLGQRFQDEYLRSTP